MAQSHHGVNQVSPDVRHAFDSSYSAIIEWHVTGTAFQTGSAVERLFVRPEMAAVLAAWRAAERSLGNHLETGPERARLKLQLVHLRTKYHQLFEAGSGGRS